MCLIPRLNLIANKSAGILRWESLASERLRFLRMTITMGVEEVTVVPSFGLTGVTFVTFTLFFLHTKLEVCGCRYYVALDSGGFLGVFDGRGCPVWLLLF